MDIVGGPIKFALANIRDYLSFLGEGLGFDGYIEATADKKADKFWMFVVVSIILGSLAFGALSTQGLTSNTITILQLTSTFWLWFVLAIIAHILSKVLGGIGAVGDTISSCVIVMAPTYVVASFAALTVGYFARVAVGHDDSFLLGSSTFLLVQLLIIAKCLPKRLVETHLLSPNAKIILSIGLPTLVLCVNIFLIFFAGGGLQNGTPLMGPK